VIILRGEGPAFCSGDDLNRVPFDAYGGVPGQKLSQSKRITGVRAITQLYQTLVDLQKPVVVEAKGTLVGVGYQMALCADIVIAGESARFTRKEQRIGFAGIDAWTNLLSILAIGAHRSRELLLTGRIIDAATAAEWGLANEVVPDDELEEATLRWARAIALNAMDGLVIGRQLHALTLAQLGFHTGWHASNLSHSLFTNLVWRDDEFNFLKERNEAGTTGEAIKDRERRWAELGF
jgi:enoyl-CoA hydratase